MSTESQTDTAGSAPEDAAAGAAAAAADVVTRGRAGRAADEAKVVDDQPASPVEEPDSFPYARILHPIEGPAILRHEWQVIAGAFHEEVAKLATDAKLAARKISRSAALKKIEEWLRHVEQVDNHTGLPGEPAPDAESESED